MSSLQLALIVAGVLIVVAVILYNAWQFRRVRRKLAEARAPLPRAESSASARTAERLEPTLGGERRAATASAGDDATPAFHGGPPADSSFEPPVDVIAPPGAPSLTTTSDVADGDPDLGPAIATADRPLHAAEPRAGDAAALAHGRATRATPQPDHEIECLVLLQPAAPAPAGALATGLHSRVGKPVRWFGRPDARSDWERLTSETSGRFADIVACMLLADRNGAASRAQLEQFTRVVGEVATALSAAFAPPDIPHELARAESLDRLCAELDVQIGLTVQMPEPASIAGTRLRGVAEASGFRLAPSGRFEFVNEDTGAVLYTLQNLRPDPFSAEMLRLTATNGVVFLLDVARLAEPARVFDAMKLAARRMAATLGAELVDDNGRALDDVALAKIREQVDGAAEALRAVHIEPGSARALALFTA
ncbi:MAG TPA: cell division protein ZipA C-terminal FtsZ-binding domain-containing protein [Casimicrobiaceae bacterium]|nr:cell division protein ZipA C-terminal FtsZ-binding domain-containing protein [Casimicrobiaceae bacterium]